MGRQPPDILVPVVPELSAPRAKRIGHKGADLIAPGNTLASFDAALEAGVDMVEFDVLPEHPDGTGRLVLAHDFRAARRGTAVTLEEGLEHFRQDAWADVELDVDLKLPGYEQRVVDALRAAGLAERAIVSTMEIESLRELRRIAPDVRLGWSVPKLRRNPLSHPVTRVASLPALQVARRVLPGRAARELRAGRIDALMAHWALVTPRLARAVREAGGELYVWTVDDARRIAALERLGVTGVITNDPRLFAGDAAVRG
jgi:glycerophosphoryl diester phosphodiesterase